jgi:myo-inositol catabolism protein IolS
MEYIKLGDSGITVSRLAFGCEQLGGYAWGDIDLQETCRAVEEAVDCGINFFDTSDTYGPHESEKNLARALGSQRKNVVISSKFGVRLKDDKTAYYDSSPAWLDSALEGSLRRLGTDYIDLYFVHYPDGCTPLEDTIHALDSKVTEGKIRCYGISNVTSAQFSHWRHSSCSAIQLEYSLANRTNEAHLHEISHSSIASPMVYGVLGQGVLAGRYRSDTTFAQNDRRRHERYVNFHGDKLTRNIQIAQKLQSMGTIIQHTASQIAVRWVLDTLPRSIAITGIKRRDQLHDLKMSLGWNLSAEEIVEISSF